MYTMLSTQCATMSLRHIFEKQKADENERASKRMMEKPGGRRHDAFTDYHQRIQMGDEVHGYDAEAVSPSLMLTLILNSIKLDR